MKSLLFFFFLSLSLAGLGQDTTNFKTVLCDENRETFGIVGIHYELPIYDTVAVWIEYADTSKPISYNMTQPGYEVKEYGGSYWGGADPNPGGIVLAVAVRREIWNHVTYLDHFKKPLPFLVWGVKERREK